MSSDLVQLGNSGIRVSKFAFGGGTLSVSGSALGVFKGSDEKDSYRILDRYIELGGNFIDTADRYTNGESEQVIGRWIQSKPNPKEFRRKLVIATKIGFSVYTNNEVNARGASRKNLLYQIEQSLKNLQTDYIDLYQIHIYDKHTPIRETLYALNEYIRQGKILYIGASNFTAEQLIEANLIAKYENLDGFITLQPNYSLIERSIEFGLLNVCKEYKVSTLIYSPLGGGQLAGKIDLTTGKAEENSRVAISEKIGMEQWANKDRDRVITINKKLDEIAKQLNTTIPIVALRWAIQREGIDVVIIGARTIEQLENNFKALKIQLNQQQMNELNEVSDVPLPYPYNFQQKYQ